MTKPKVQLVLRSADINPTIRTYTGNAPTEPTGEYTNPITGSYINRWRTHMIFNDINLFINKLKLIFLYFFFLLIF